jgi:hypothetical protein
LDENGTVTKFLRNTVDRFCDPYIPFKTGLLKNNKQYPNNHSIKYVSPYSHYHYKGKKAEGPSRPKGVKRTISSVSMKYSGAPKRGPEWDKRMMNDRRKDVCKDVENFIKNGGR